MDWNFEQQPAPAPEPRYWLSEFGEMVFPDPPLDGSGLVRFQENND